MARINAVSFHEDPSIESICRKVRQAGFDSLEVSRPPFFNKLTTSATRQRFRDWTEELGLSLYGFDCWVDVDPYERRQETLADFRAAVEFAAELNLGKLISHDPWQSVNASRSPSQCLASSVELFREVVDLCEQHALRLVFEPHPDTLSMQNTWAIDFIDALSRDRRAASVSILYDSCHYGVGQPQRYVEAIGELGTRIGHVHFSDGDRQTYALHLPFGDGSLDLDGIVAALGRAGCICTMTNDLYNYPLLEDGARRNLARLREVEALLNIPDRI